MVGVVNVEIRLNADTKRDVRRYFGWLTTRLAMFGADAAKQAVPVNSGKLRASIGHRKTGTYSAAFFAASNYARFVEDGTGIYGFSGQRIKPIQAKSLAWAVDPNYPRYNFRTVVARLGYIPTLPGSKHFRPGEQIYITPSVAGQKAQPFLQPAAERLRKEFPVLVIRISREFQRHVARKGEQVAPGALRALLTNPLTRVKTT